ncbi:unnamed protein product [Paramecium sonneborni]|uniref:Protein kinase domain-containing protein n=1 Tax=Paramecium sonneborni TaxID=65129 RepID=A0A8S1P1X5_9CILI|nr:unnamed protein product [Paramecium sonneborni]
MNTYQQLVNSVVVAPTNEYPKREFILTKLFGVGNEGAAYFATAYNWGNNPKQVSLKLQNNMKQNQKQFIQSLIEQQNTYEKGNNQQYLPSNIIRIYEYFEWESYNCIIMEEGSESLYDYIAKNNNQSIDDKIKICFQIIQPIHFLHKQKLIHRDIRPENYIKVGDNFKLIDFGLVQGSAPFDLKTQPVGTLIFQAPELIESQNNFTEKVDIWALACVFYEVLSFKSLFVGQTFNQISIQIKKHKTDLAWVHNKINQLQTPEEIKKLIISMLNYTDKERPSIDKVCDEFQKYLNKNNIAQQVANNQSTLTSPANQQPFQGNLTEAQIIKLIEDKYESKIQFLKVQKETFKKQIDSQQNEIDQLKLQLQAAPDINLNKLSEPQITKLIENKCQSIILKLLEVQKEIHEKQIESQQNEINQLKLQSKDQDNKIEQLQQYIQQQQQQQQEQQIQQQCQQNQQIQQQQQIQDNKFKIEAPNSKFVNRKFELINKLGEGAQGSVYLAKSINWGLFDQKQYALKFQQITNDNETQFIDNLIQYQNQYENQFNIDQQNNQPSGLIRIYERFKWQGYDVLIMEKGEIDLQQFINEQKQLTFQQKLEILIQISQSIQFLHKQQLIHRDIKPENFIKIGNQFKLIDFGLIRFNDQINLTKRPGTTQYSAPEIIECQKVYTLLADVWSLGCVFYEILQNQQLFTGESENKAKQQIKNSDYLTKKINQLQANEQMKSLMKKMLNPNFQQRIQINEIVQTLQNMERSIYTIVQQNFPFVKQINIQNNQEQTLKNNLIQFPIQKASPCQFK